MTSLWIVSRAVKRAFRYRFYPTDGQAAELARTFGCVRKVDNLALSARTEAWTLRQERVTYKSAECTTSAFRCRDGRRILAKMAEPLDIVWSRPLPEGASPSAVTVSQDAAGRWFVSLLCTDVIPESAKIGAVGIDAGLDHLLTLSTGEKISNPRHERADRGRLARAQRNLSRKDRDVNAARNPLAEGLSVIACGGGVRPQRESSRTGSRR